MLGEATSHPRPGAVAGSSNPRSSDCMGIGRPSGARKGGGKEIPLMQGKEQRLCFAGAAVKRYPMPKVRETQIRW